MEAIRIAGRRTRGVVVFNTAAGERVGVVERISQPEAGGEEGEQGLFSRLRVMAVARRPGRKSQQALDCSEVADPYALG